MKAEELIDFHWRTIGRYDHYIATTNAKAAFLIAWNTFAVGTVSLKWSALSLQTSGLPKTEALVTICLSIGLLAAIASLWQTFRVVNPFLDSPRRPLKYHSLIFFRHVAEFESDADYNDAATRRSSGEVAADLAAQGYILARGLNSKFVALRWAIGMIIFVQLPAILLVAAIRVLVAVGPYI